jgi:uncharacterized delta-60 repeat protein
MKKVGAALLAVGLVAISAGTGSAYSGVLDPAFNGDGSIALGRGDNAFLAARSDGVVITATQTFGRTGAEVTLRAVGPDGALDPSFSGDGVATPNLGNTVEIDDLAVDAENRILVLAYANAPQVFRLTANGRVDTTFGVNGKRVFSEADTFPGALAIDSAGRIVASLTKGVAGTGTRTDALVARLLPGGRFDATFGNDGVRTLDLSRADLFSEVDVDALDRPVLASGTFFQAGPVRVVRLTEARGRLDASFSGDGIATQRYPDTVEPLVTTVSADSGVTVGGVLFADGGLPAFAVRFTEDGSPDTSFSTDGEVTFATGTKQGMAATAVDQAGAVVAAGFVTTGRETSDPLVGGVLADGSPDLGFGPGGRAVLPVGKGLAEAGPGLIVDGQFVVLVRSQVVEAKRVTTSYQLVRLLTDTV